MTRHKYHRTAPRETLTLAQLRAQRGRESACEWRGYRSAPISAVHVARSRVEKCELFKHTTNPLAHFSFLLSPDPETEGFSVVFFERERKRALCSKKTSLSGDLFPLKD